MDDEITTFCEHCNPDDDAAGYTPPQNHSKGLIAGLALASPPQRPPPSSVTIPPRAAHRIEALVDHLYSLGKRPIYELLCSVYGGADVIAALEEFRRLDRQTLTLLGADRLPRCNCKRQRWAAS